MKLEHDLGAGVSQTAFGKIARVRVSDRVAAEILRLIASGDLPPGEKLPAERQLAEMMKVSRVSIRAALQRLQGQGFVSAVQGGGTRVVSATGDTDPALTELVRIDRSNLHDLAEIRSNLEVWAARRAAENARPKHLKEMAASLEAMASPERDAHERALDDVAFHLAVARASGSAVYNHILTVIRDILTEMLDYHRYELFGTPADDAAVLAQHQAIYDAIEARDASGAAEAMDLHLSWVLDHYRTPEGAAGSASRSDAAE